MLVHELGEVFVARRNKRFYSSLRRLLGECTNDIVGFDTWNNQHGQSHGLHDLMDRFDLRTQFVGHRRASRFVV